MALSAPLSYVDRDRVTVGNQPDDPIPVYLADGGQINIGPSVQVSNEVEVKNDSGKPLTVSDAVVSRVTGALSLAPNATGVLISHLAATTEKAHSVAVSGSGDALVEVFKDAVKQDETRLNAIRPRDSLFLGFSVPIGSSIEVRVSCSALATADFFAAYLYE